MPLVPIKQFVAFAVLIILTFLGGSVESKNPPTHFGFQLAVPATEPLIDSAAGLPHVPGRLFIDLLLRVDTGGEVNEVLAASAKDSLFVNYYENYLATMTFHPGKLYNEPTEQILPVRLKFSPYMRIPELVFPLDSAGLIADRDFYFSAFELNDIHLPRVKSFPSYNYQFKDSPGDSLSYPYFLVQLSLDETGRPTDIEKLTAQCPPFTEQIINAINWGKYTPLKVRGKPKAVESFLLITHLPQASYPAREYIAGDSTLALRDFLRVRLLPDTFGLLTPPLPRNIIDDKIVCSNRDVIGAGDAIVRVSIDTLGKVKYLGLNYSNQNKKKNVIAALENLKFYPALNFQGHPQSYKGYLKLSFNATRSVGVEMLWFSP